MSTPGSYPQSSPIGSDFPPDKVWGTCFIILYALMLVVVLALFLGVGSLLAFAASTSHGPTPPIPTFFPAAIAVIVGILVGTSLVAHIVAAVGIHKSRAWGFWATIALSVISLVSSSGGTCLTVIPLVYSVVRLAGSFGPKPS